MSVGSFPSLGDLRVVTLNVWGSHYPTEVGMARVEPGADLPEAWLRRRDALRAGLQPLTPDLVAFQEVLCREGYDQVVDLLGPGYHVWHHPVREADGSGNSIASRWPFGEVRDMDHHITDRVGRHLLTVAEIRTPEPVGPLLFVHPSASYQMPFELERQLEALTTARIVEDLVGIDCPHVVLAGDFNAAPDTASMRFWRGRQTLDGTGACYVDAWDDVHRGQPGHTFTPENAMMNHNGWPLERGRRIDYIFVRCALQGPTLRVTGCQRIFDEPVDGVWASDHFGVVADMGALSS
jgi:endonuclease/exonuclease/phosphatase family metal-dependent hydrolase